MTLTEVIRRTNIVTQHRHYGELAPAVQIGTCWRCTHCGHRVDVNGVAPRQTRSMPLWRWPAELIARVQAKARPY